MAEDFSPEELRQKAREHRSAAKNADTPAIRKTRIALAVEYERLADDIEATQAKKKPAS